MKYFIKKEWVIPEEQPSGRDFPDGLFSPDIKPVNRLNFDVSDEEYVKIHSALELGASIAYPDEWSALVDVWLYAMLDNDQSYLSDGTYYRMDAPFVKWYPADPYNDSDNDALNIFLFPSWFIYTFEYPEFLTDFFQFFGIEWDTFLGFRTGDVISTILNMRNGNLLADVSNWLFGTNADTFPKIGFEIHVNGSGVMALEVLSVPAGGRVLWQVDEPITIVDKLAMQTIFDADDDLLETELDITSLPPEQDVEDVEEIVITGDGNHIIYVQLLPVLNDALNFFNFGAGFRSIRLGDGLKPVDPNTGEIITDLSTSTNNLGLITMSETELTNSFVRAHEIIAARTLLAQDSNIISDVSVSSKDLSTAVESGISRAVRTDINADSDETRNGGVRRQAEGIANLLKEIQAFKLQTFAVENVVNIARVAINPLDFASFSALVTAYYNSAENIVIDVALLSEYLFCSGDSTSIIQYAIANGHTEAEINYLSQFYSEIPSSKLIEWYNIGAAAPLSDYLGYACRIREDVTIEITSLTANVAQYIDIAGYAGLTQGRKVRLTWSGVFTDSATGNTIDAAYQVVNSVQDPANWLAFGFAAQNDNYLQAVPSQISKDANGDYQFSSEIVADDYYAIVVKPPNYPWINSAIGTMTLLIQDLGAN